MYANNETSRSNTQEELDKIQDGLFYLTGEEDISICELMSQKFIRENTDFSSLAELFSAAGVKSDKDLDSGSFNEFIKLHTCFSDWEEMLIQSSNQYPAEML